MLRNRNDQNTNDLLYYLDGKLVGFLGMYVFNKREMEISGMVHPNFRGKGIFRELIVGAIDECKRRGIPKLLFICDYGSNSGKRFLELFGASYRFSEYKMSFRGDLPKDIESTIIMERVKYEELELIAKLDSIAFQLPMEEMLEFAKSNFSDANRELYIIRNHEGKIIGKISVHLSDHKAYIYGFAISPEYRGQGYGRAALSRFTSYLVQKNLDEISLEVESKNLNALKLYQSCGFAIDSGYDYYEWLI
jgi:ribosomal protein S18 acetylase RimI-like enzyme